MIRISVRIIRVIGELLIELICWLRTGHEWQVVDQYRTRFAEAHLEIRSGDLVTVERCSNCPAIKTTFGGQK